MKKRLVLFLMVCTMCASVLVGCQGTKPEGAVSGKTDISSGEEEAGGADGGSDESTSTEGAAYRKTDDSWEFSQTGLKMDVPDSIKECSGSVFAADFGEIELGSGVFAATISYVGRTDKEKAEFSRKANAITNDTEMDEDSRNEKWESEIAEFFSVGYMDFFDIIAVKDGTDAKEAAAKAFGDLHIGKIEELGQSGDFKYYYVEPDAEAEVEQYKDNISPEMLEEYYALVADADRLAAAITVNGPDYKGDVGGKVGDQVSFETKDVKGKPVKSEDIFSGHKVTMVNIWATWCEPCKNEMPMLQELNEEIEGKGCQIIGICSDTLDAGQAVEEAQRILEEKGVTYTNLVQTDELKRMLPTEVYPISFFIDSEGTILTDPCTGDDTDYETAFEQALAQVG